MRCGVDGIEEGSACAGNLLLSKLLEAGTNKRRSHHRRHSFHTITRSKKRLDLYWRKASEELLPRDACLLEADSSMVPATYARLKRTRTCFYDLTHHLSLLLCCARYPRPPWSVSLEDVKRPVISSVGGCVEVTLRDLAAGLWLSVTD